MSKSEKSNTNNGPFQVVAKSQFNNIGYEITIPVSAEKVVALAGEGLEKLVGGKPSARLDAVLGFNPNERNDVKRPELWKRSSIQYTDANAAKLGEVFSEFLAKEGFEGFEVRTFQKGTNAAIDTAKQVLASMTATGVAMGIEGFVAQWAKNVIGYAGNDLTADNIEFLAAIAASNKAIAVK